MSDSVYLTIADALIGEVLSTQYCQHTINAGFKPSDCGYSDEEFDNFTDDQKREIIGNWCFNIELEADYQHNPIFQKVAELMRETKSSGYSISFLNENDRDSKIWTWVECEVKNYKYGGASAKVYLPNFNTPSCYFIVHIAIEIAQLLALEKIKKKRIDNKSLE